VVPRSPRLARLARSAQVLIDFALRHLTGDSERLDDVPTKASSWLRLHQPALPPRLKDPGRRGFGVGARAGMVRAPVARGVVQRFGFAE
jgi:hypothetical protein